MDQLQGLYCVHPPPPPPPNAANSFAVRRMCTTTAKLPGTASPYSLNGSRTLKRNRLSPGGEGPSLTAMLLGTHALSPTFSFKKVVVAEKSECLARTSKLPTATHLKQNHKFSDVLWLELVEGSFLSPAGRRRQHQHLNDIIISHPFPQRKRT